MDVGNVLGVRVRIKEIDELESHITKLAGVKNSND